MERIDNSTAGHAHHIELVHLREMRTYFFSHSKLQNKEQFISSMEITQFLIFSQTYFLYCIDGKGRIYTTHTFFEHFME